MPFRTAVVGQYLTALATDCYLSRGWFTPLSISKLQDGDFIEKRVGSSIQNDGVGRTKLVLVLERQLVTSLFQSTSKLTPANDQIATPKYRTRLGAFITPAFTITDSQLVPSTLFSRHFESQRIPLSYSPVDFVIVTLEVHKSANGVFAGYDSIRTFKNLLKMTHALPGRTAQVAFDGIEDAKGILASVGVDEECRVGDIPVNTLVQIAAIGHARGIRGLAHGF